MAETERLMRRRGKSDRVRESRLMRKLKPMPGAGAGAEATDRARGAKTEMLMQTYGTDRLRQTG